MPDRDRHGRGDAKQSRDQASSNKRSHPEEDGRRQDGDSQRKASKSRSEIRRRVENPEEAIETKIRNQTEGNAKQKGGGGAGQIKSEWVWVPCVPESKCSLEFFQQVESGVVA